MKELDDLKNAITQLDVNATIQDEDVKYLNAVIKASEALEKKLMEKKK